MTEFCSCLSLQSQLQRTSGSPSGQVDDRVGAKPGQTQEIQCKGWTSIKPEVQEECKTEEERKSRKEQIED